MEFDIDVSGEDILNRDYTVCIANKGNTIKGYKITQEFINIINLRYGQELYRYNKSKNGRALLKVRIYCIIIYHIFKSINVKEEITLNICRDFNGREEDVKSNLKYFVGDLLKLNIKKIFFQKLDKDSNAHRYAYLMRRDTKNKLKTYVSIKFDDIEKFLKK